MDRRLLYVVLGALAVLVVGLGVQLQHERDKTTGLSIDITKEHGLTIEQKIP